MPASVFISYSSQDEAAARAILQGLEHDGISCWIASRDIPPGAIWAAEITRAISECTCFLLVFSPRANASPQVANEVILAVQEKKEIFCLTIEDSERNAELRYHLARVQRMDATAPPLRNHIPAAARRLKATISRLQSAAHRMPPAPSDDVKGSPSPKKWSSYAWMGIVALLLVSTVGGFLYLSDRFPVTFVTRAKALELASTRDLEQLKLAAPPDAPDEWIIYTGPYTAEGDAQAHRSATAQLDVRSEAFHDRIDGQWYIRFRFDSEPAANLAGKTLENALNFKPTSPRKVPRGEPRQKPPGQDSSERVVPGSPPATATPKPKPPALVSPTPKPNVTSTVAPAPAPQPPTVAAQPGTNGNESQNQTPPAPAEPPAGPKAPTGLRVSPK
jgi:hypothetical protein